MDDRNLHDGLRVGSALLVACLVLGGCSFGESASRGELGRAEFAWNEGLLGCLFGCNAREPVAVGSIALMDVVNAEDLPPFSAVSDAPEIIDFSLAGEASVRCEAHQAGTAALVLLDTTGQQVDRFEVDSRQPDRIEVANQDLFRERYTLMVGGTDSIGFRLFDGNRELRGVGAVEYGFSGGIGPTEATLTDALTEALVNIFVGANSEYVEIEAHALGEGLLEVNGPPGVTASVPVTIVGPEAITEISLEDPRTLSVGESDTVFATVQSGREPVYGAVCAWQLAPADGPFTIRSESSDFAVVEATGAGTATLTCTVGSATGQVEVRATQ